MAELVFYRRGEELMRVLLDGQAMVVGRGSSADIAVPHPEVSRRQALLERRGERFVAIDLSGRGLRIGNQIVAEEELEDGTEIWLGDFRAVFQEKARSTHAETRSGGEFTKEAGSVRRVNVPVNLRIRAPSGERHRLLEGELVIGTDPGCGLMLDDAYASGVHCRLIHDGGRIQLFDLGSTNGTWVNGLRVGHAELAMGAMIRIGETEIALEPVDQKGESSFEGIVSQAACMKEVFDLVERVAPSSAPVTILGETGTGKELIARAIHARSERIKGPFVPVNCAAISRELIESELFGHEKGAFTGALTARKGAFEEASGGTIFLDEIGELSADLQAKLLRTLELGEVKRVGSSRPFRVDARVVAATHRDLRAMVKTGAFREDLYYRLAVIRVELPPLRRRPGDVPLLAERLAKAFAPRGGMPGFKPEALLRLEAHPWPGNVRELKNVLARALLLRRGTAITPDDLTFDEVGAEAVASIPDSDDENAFIRLPGKTIQQIELEATLKALRRHKGNRRAAARELDLARSTMQLRAKELGVPPPSNEPDE
ncbi:MAG TPA: sigma 54-interacting transcriptional regulator [Vulgatibacter sp.]